MATLIPTETVEPPKRLGPSEASSLVLNYLGSFLRGPFAPMLALLVLCCVHIRGDLFGDEITEYQRAMFGLEMLGTGEPANLWDITVVLDRLALWITGGRPWSIRLPSAAFAVFTVYFLGKLGVRVFGENAGAWARWLGALSPMLVEFGQEGRPYVSYCLFSVLLAYQLLRFIDRESWWNGLVLALVACVGCLTRTLFVANLAFGVLLYLGLRRGVTVRALTVAAVVAPCVIRLGLLSARYSSIAPKLGDSDDPISWINFVGRAVIALNFGYCAFWVPDTGAARNVAVWPTLMTNLPVAILALLGLGGVIVGMWLSLRAEPKGCCILWGAVLVPAGIIVVLGYLGYSVVREKYLIGCLGAYLALVGYALWQVSRRGWSGRILVVAFMATVGISLARFSLAPEVYSRRMFPSSLNAALERKLEPGDLVMAYHLNRREPWYYKVVDQPGTSFIDLHKEKVKGVDIRSLVVRKDQETRGTIYLIRSEGMQNWVDPGNLVVQALAFRRARSLEVFGRNLLLETFRLQVDAPEAVRTER